MKIAHFGSSILGFILLLGCEVSSVTNYSRCMNFADRIKEEQRRVEFAKECAKIVNRTPEAVKEP